MIGPKKGLLFGKATTAIRPQDVFKVISDTGANTQAQINALGWPGYMVWTKRRDASQSWYVRNTLSGTSVYMPLDTTGSEASYAGVSGTSPYTTYAFKQSPGFMDMRLFTHTSGTADTYDFKPYLGFNVGMVICKSRNVAGNWNTWFKGMGTTDVNLDDTSNAGSGYFTVTNGSVTFSASAPSGNYVMFAFADNPDIQRFDPMTIDEYNQGQISHSDWADSGGLQFLVMKNTTSGETWSARDTTRNPSPGWNGAANNDAYYLQPSESSAEASGWWIQHFTDHATHSGLVYTFDPNLGNRISLSTATTPYVGNRLAYCKSTATADVLSDTSGPWPSAITNDSCDISSGKYAFEVVWDKITNSERCSVGIVCDGSSANTSAGTNWIGASDKNGIGYWGGPNDSFDGWNFGGSTGGFASAGNYWVNGTKVQVMFDLTNKLAWATIDGTNYYGAQQCTKSDVASGNYGFSFSTIHAGPWKPAVNFGVAGDIARINTGQPSLASYPSGFSWIASSRGSYPNNADSLFYTWAIRSPT